MPGPVRVTLDVLFEQALRHLSNDYPTLSNALIADFEIYAASEGRQVPANFGRDSIFNEPYLAQRAKLRHIHVCLPPNTFNPNLVQWDRTNAAGSPDRDAFLVYVHHEFYENQYLLVAFMCPDAHDEARDREVMKRLGYIAQDFQDS